MSKPPLINGYQKNYLQLLHFGRVVCRRTSARTDGLQKFPAKISYNKDGSIAFEEWYVGGEKNVVKNPHSRHFKRKLQQLIKECEVRQIIEG